MKPIAFHKFCAGYGLTLTPAQRVLTSVCFDHAQPCDLRGDDRDLARVLFGQVDTIPPIAREVIAWKKGARIGGSRMAAMRLYQLGSIVPLDLAPGETAYGIIVAPDLRLARQTFSYVVGAAKQDERDGKIALVRESSDSIAWERHDGNVVTIECLPATVGGSAVRARTLFGAVLSEASFFRDSDYAINDGDIFRGLAPRVVAGGQTIIESTAWAAVGLLHDLINANHGAPRTALAAIAPTLLMRPDDRTRAIVERELERDETNAQREFFCIEQATGSEQFFDAIDRCVDLRLPMVIEAPEGAIKSAGADLGLVENSSALVIGATYKHVFMPIEILELKPKKGAPLRLSYVIQEFAAVVKRHGLRSFTADHHMLVPAREWAGAAGITIRAIKGGNEEKTAQHLALRQAMREDRVRLPNNPRLLAQLRSITSRPLSGGGMRIDAPTHGQAHADIASALVIAHAGASTGGARWSVALQGWTNRGGAQGAAERLGFTSLRDVHDFDDLKRAAGR